MKFILMNATIDHDNKSFSHKLSWLGRMTQGGRRYTKELTQLYNQLMKLTSTLQSGANSLAVLQQNDETDVNFCGLMPIF